MTKAKVQTEAPAMTPYTYAAVSLYDHWTKDMARFWESMSRASGPGQVLQAETALDNQLWRDYVEAMQDLWMLPMRMTVAALGAGEQAAKESNSAG